MGVEVIGEHCVRTNENLIIYRYSAGNENICLDLATITDLDTSLHLNKGGDLAVTTYRATVKIDEIANDRAFSYVAVLYGIEICQ
jgi:hypothetical protein